MASQPTPGSQPPPHQAGNSANNIITALGNAFRSQTGEPLSGDKIAQLLFQNMNQLGELAKQGKLNQEQIMQVRWWPSSPLITGHTNLKQYADKYKPQAAATAATSSTSAIPQAAPAPTAAPATPLTKPAPYPSQLPHPGVKPTNSPAPVLSQGALTQSYPISDRLEGITNPGPVPWTPSQQGRPTLTGGMAAGRMAGTPAQVARGGEDVSMFNFDDNRARRKNTPGDQSMRRSIQDLVSSIDPNVRIEPDVEDLLLDIADEFIDSVTNFGCRLAKHRGGDTLEVRDLQLHLERNHNIRIPGFASDDTRVSLAQATVANAASGPAKKAGQGTHMTLRSHRLAQVQQAKRENKLM
ncbi:hypothetical protein PUNSTDRAFT_131560 [Punctularia strigosozonata HHB-11173 SS5]|uniref:uncharacterized protein n=1 Tax=Punctularia strigosozonata (strain HHB-11173) TaxID=741275 RepID=UPI0004417C7E|nr:uncharacterized protein PUNSTDRAFT_131560 [Punctularia strigosozonata HHB-11173 SS5]EIN11396.1 hypothetical protein PUNSTDRAFT_131560 [Punctularia strigosozonata HHB-11173 SS5]